eukprot:3754514-Amphidinium_carterae.1
MGKKVDAYYRPQLQSTRPADVTLERKTKVDERGISVGVCLNYWQPQQRRSQMKLNHLYRNQKLYHYHRPQSSPEQTDKRTKITQNTKKRGIL